MRSGDSYRVLGSALGRYSLLEYCLLTIGAAGVGIAAFDVLRKTVFIDAWWNYRYPADSLIYDFGAVGLLVAILVAVAVGAEVLLELSDRQFVLLLYALTLAVSVLSFFATPVKSARWIEPSSGYFYAATVAAERGPLEYFAAFHSLGTPYADGDNLETARYLTAALRSAEFLPGHEALAAYASEITVQKHGPIPPLLVSPFVALLGPRVESAAVGSYALTTTVPLVGYAAFRGHFARRRARFGALLIALAPAYLVYQRYESVAWDAITAVLVGASVYLFLRAMRDREGRGGTEPSRRALALAGSGVFASLAVLSKISAATILIGYAAAFAWTGEFDTLRSSLSFGIPAAAVPLGLLAVGYNTLIQVLFSVARIRVESTGHPITHPASYLNDPLLSVLGPAYNGRLLGPALLVFAGVFLGAVLHDLVRRRRLPVEDRERVACCFLVSLLPFAVALPGRTISRHLLPLVVPIGFVALCGLSVAERRSDRDRPTARTLRVSVVATGLVALIAL